MSSEIVWHMYTKHSQFFSYPYKLWKHPFEYNVQTATLHFNSKTRKLRSWYAINLLSILVGASCFSLILKDLFTVKNSLSLFHHIFYILLTATTFFLIVITYIFLKHGSELNFGMTQLSLILLQFRECKHWF